jgi:hypothetical protein
MSSATVIFLKIANSEEILEHCILYLFQYDLLNITIGLSVHLRQAEPLVPGKLGVSPGNNQYRRKGLGITGCRNIRTRMKRITTELRHSI